MIYTTTLNTLFSSLKARVVSIECLRARTAGEGGRPSQSNVGKTRRLEF